MNVQFTKVVTPSAEIVDALNKWDNDPVLIPLTRPNQNREEMETRRETTVNELKTRLNSHDMFLIYLENKLVGEMNYMIDPGHLYRKVKGTAWIGITIGEPEGRGKGIGFKAIQYLEGEIKKKGLSRIELGVFEFNSQAHRLYHQLGYQEIGRIPEFTYWNEKMWTDIRMEKHL
ncbi:GNAT family N-acetyltransferase [Rossellomorea aquimaris]|uniref:GNAT family N-acetyltransferase n=1 Tax=Rossellomorea aquimaris TaxID=189382 RepID=UPI001CD28236|nr:GNAT family N-acetyltransferase [Rossellomorea aquimaris]MCA1058855.1 GNAT family N-acetyltransferase [Rossellomorea aquimaris]